MRFLLRMLPTMLLVFFGVALIMVIRVPVNQAHGEAVKIDQLVVPPGDDPPNRPPLVRRDFDSGEFSAHLKSEAYLIHFLLRVAAGEVTCEDQPGCILDTDFRNNVQTVFDRCQRLEPSGLRFSTGFLDRDHGSVQSAVESACYQITSRATSQAIIGSDSELKQNVLAAKGILDKVGGELR